MLLLPLLLFPLLLFEEEEDEVEVDIEEDEVVEPVIVAELKDEVDELTPPLLVEVVDVTWLD